MSTLDIRDLHVSVDTEYGPKEILTGVDLTIRSGRPRRRYSRRCLVGGCRRGSVRSSTSWLCRG